MTLRGLIGAMLGCVAALLLLLCLAETRPWFGQTRWGVAWTSRWGLLRFDPIGWPLLFLSIPAAPLGYVIGTRLYSRRAMVFALGGAVVGAALLWLLPPGRVSQRDSRAGQNNQIMAAYLGALLGAAAAAEIAVRLDQRRRNRK